MNTKYFVNSTVFYSQETIIQLKWFLKISFILTKKGNTKINPENDFLINYKHLFERLY